jgi:hypothetical protein
MDNNLLHSVLKDAVYALAHAKFDDVRVILDKPYKKAMDAETSEAVKQQASYLYENLWIASSDAARYRLPLEKVRKYVLNKFDFTIITNEEKFEQSANLLHKYLHNISENRLLQAEAFTKHEAQLMEQFKGGSDGLLGVIKGKIAYNIDLVKRRWIGDHHAGTEIILDAAKEVSNEASKLPPPEPPKISLTYSTNSFLDNNLIANKTPKPQVHSVILESTGMQEYGGVKQLNNNLRKAGALLMGGTGAVLVVHGARNMFCAFNPKQHQHLLLEGSQDTASERKIDWAQLAVGTAEAIAGSALIYRSATGRWSTDVLRGSAERFFECKHELGK